MSTPLQAGTILISAPTLDDPNFEKVVIYIVEYNDQGALGFVMNHLFNRKFNELTEFRHSKPFPLYVGGPVEKEKLYFIHRVPGFITAGKPVADGVQLSGNFKQAVNYINTAADADNNLRLFIGYSGWDAHQLEEEIEEGSWLPVKASVTPLFEVPEQLLWEELYKRIHS